MGLETYLCRPIMPTQDILLATNEGQFRVADNCNYFDLMDYNTQTQEPFRRLFGNLIITKPCELYDFETAFNVIGKNYADYSSFMDNGVTIVFRKNDNLKDLIELRHVDIPTRTENHDYIFFEKVCEMWKGANDDFYHWLMQPTSSEFIFDKKTLKEHSALYFEPEFWDNIYSRFTENKHFLWYSA